MAERELPTLRVKLVGDATGFAKMVKEAEAEMNKLAAAIQSATRTAAASAGVKSTIKAAVKLGEEVIVDSIKKLMNSAGNVAVSGAEIKRSMKAAVQLVAEFLVYYTKRLVDGIASMRVSGDAIKTTAKQAVELIRDFIVYYVKQLVNGIASMRISGAEVTATAKQAVVIIRDFIVYYVKRLVDGIANINVSGAQITTVARQAVIIVRDFLVYYIKRLVDGIANIRVSGAGVTTVVRDAVRIARDFIIYYIRQLMNNIGNINPAGGPAIRAEIRRAVRASVTAIISVITASATAVTQQMSGQVMYQPMIRNAYRRIIREGLQAILFAMQASVQAAALTINVQPMANRMVNGLRRAMDETISRMLLGFGSGARRATGQGQARGGTRGGGGGGGFGDMASSFTIGTNVQAIETLRNSLAVPVNALVSWQQMESAMVGFTGSVQNAADTMEILSKQALASPYGIQEIAKGTNLMMGYGMETKKAIEVSKMIGDVAMGNKLKFGQLALAMAQINSLGKLQGQELRQLAEHGFNPLRTIAKDLAEKQAKALGLNDVEKMKLMTKEMRRLESLKREGLITSEMVNKALEVETAQGGVFAGQAQRASQTLGGMAQQLREIIQLIYVRAFKTIEQDLVAAIKRIVDYLKALEIWMNTHKAAVESFMRFVIAIVKGLVAFYAARAAVGVLIWHIRSLSVLLGVVGSIFGGFVNIFLVGFRAIAAASVLTGVVIRFSFMSALGISAALFSGFSAVVIGSYRGIVAASRLTTNIIRMGGQAMALSMRTVSTALGGVRAAFALTRIAALSAWLAMTAPISGPILVIIAVIMGVVMAVLMVTRAITGGSGLIDSFWGALDTVRTFATNAVGFMWNFGENIQKLGSWIWNNFYNIFEDIGNIISQHAMNMSHNWGVAVRASIRILGLIFAWLRDNAFNLMWDAMTGVYNAVVGVFNMILKLGEGMWDLIFNPTKLGAAFAKGFGGFKELEKKLGEDDLRMQQEGFAASLGNVISEESARLRFGIDTSQFRSSALPDFNLKGPDLTAFTDAAKSIISGDMSALTGMLPEGAQEAMDKIKDLAATQGKDVKDLLAEMFDTSKLPPEITDIPMKPEVDWEQMIKEAEGQDVAVKVKAAPDAVALGSSEHAVRVWEHSQRMRAASKGAGAMDANADKQDKANGFLKRIEKNTRAFTGDVVENANLQTMA